MLYFSKADKHTEDTHLNTPLMIKNFAATLDPREFHHNLELPEKNNKKSSESLERVPVLDDQPIYNNYLKSKTSQKRIEVHKAQE